MACVFIAVSSLHLDYNSEFVAETTKPWSAIYLHFPPRSPPLFLDVITEVFFQLWFAKSFPRSVSLPRLSPLLGTSISTTDLPRALSSFSSQKCYFFREVFLKILLSYFSVSPFSSFFLYFCIVFCVYLISVSFTEPTGRVYQTFSDHLLHKRTSEWIVNLLT